MRTVAPSVALPKSAPRTVTRVPPRTFPLVGSRALALAKSELRLEPEVEPIGFTEVLPRPAVFPPSHDPDNPDFLRNAMPYATALAGACPWLSLDGNLLPEERIPQEHALREGENENTELAIDEGVLDVHRHHRHIS